jgi:hypothetical protein
VEDSALGVQQCRVCRSINRAEIDRRLLAGETLASLVQWLGGLGEKVSTASLSRHHSRHLAVTEEAKRILEERRGPIREAARAIVDDADTLAEVASIGLEVARALKWKMSDPDAKRSLPDVQLFTGALREAREAAAARHDVLNGKKVSVDANVSGGLAGLFAELEKAKRDADDD